MKSIKESIFDDDEIVQTVEKASVDNIKNIMSQEQCYGPSSNINASLNNDFIDITSSDRNYEVHVYGDYIESDTKLIGEYVDNLGKFRFNGDINITTTMADETLLGSNVYGRRIFIGSNGGYGEYSVGDSCNAKDINFTLLKQISSDLTTPTSISPDFGQFIITSDFEFKNINVNFDYNPNKIANHHCISVHYSSINPMIGLKSNAKMLLYVNPKSSNIIDDIFSQNSNYKSISDIHSLLASKKRKFNLPLVEFKSGVNLEKLLGLSGLPELEYIVIRRYNKYNIVFYKPSKTKLCQYIMGDPILDGIYKKRLELLPEPTADGWTMFTYINR